MQLLARTKIWFWLNMIVMALVSLITLSRVGLSGSIPYHFDFSAEPRSTAPAILVTLFFPLLLWLLQGLILRSKQSQDNSALYVFGAIAFVISSAHTFICVYSW